MITINDNLQNYSPKALDNKHGKFVSGIWQPYDSVAEANSRIHIAYRHKGLTVIVLDGGFPTEYWYRDGVSDGDLIVKNVIYTEDSSSIQFSGLGNIQDPLSAVTLLSENPNNAIRLLSDGLFAEVPIKEGVIYGGLVSWVEGYTFHISAAGYYINGRFYESPETIITLSEPDATNNRIDTFIVNNEGNATVLEGTPSATPAQATLDPATQLQLSFVIVETGTTQPSINNTCIYNNNAEWTSLSSTIRINAASAVNPCSGDLSIEGTNVINGDNLVLTRPGGLFDPTDDYTLMTFDIRSKGAWGGNNGHQRKLVFQFRSGTTNVGSAVSLLSGTNGFDSSDTFTCQSVTLSLTPFNITSPVDNLLITATLTNGSIGFFIDNICLQGMGVPEPPVLGTDEKVKVSANDTTAGYLNGKLIQGAGITLTELNDGTDETFRVAHTDSSSISNLDTSAAQVIDTMTFDTFGHVQTVTTRNLTLSDLGYTPVDVTANNGLTENVSNNIQLGGLLIKNTTIDTDQWRFKLDNIDSFSFNTYWQFENGKVTHNGSDGNTTLDFVASPTDGFYVYGSNIANTEYGFSEINATYSNLEYRQNGVTTGLLNNNGSGGTPWSLFAAGQPYMGIYLDTSGVRIGKGAATNDLNLKGIQVYPTKEIAFDNYPNTRDDGNTTKALYVDATGNVKYGTVSGSDTNFAANDLTLTGNRIHTFGSNTMLFTGSPSSSLLTITQSGTGDGLTVTAGNTAYGVYATGATGVQGNSTTGFAVVGNATTSGIGILGDSVSGQAGYFRANPSSTNTVSTVATFQRLTSGTAANDIGGQIAFSVEAADGVGYDSNFIASKWVDATALSRSSQLEIWGINSTVSARKLAIAPSGQVILDAYGDGTFEDTPTFILGAKADGTIIEVDPADLTGGGGSDTNFAANDLTLTGNRTHTFGSNIMSFLGSANSQNLLTVTNSGTGSATAIAGVSTNGAAITGTSTSNYGGSFIGSGTFALHASSPLGAAYLTRPNPSGTSSVSNVAVLESTLTGFTVANGFGASLDFKLEDTSGGSNLSSQIISKWTTATSASRVSSIEFWGVNAGATARKMAIAGSGQLIADAYTSSSSFSGTPAGLLAFDSSGNIITVSTSGVGSDTNFATTDLTATGNRTHTWDSNTSEITFNSLAGASGFKLSSTSTAATGSTQRLVDIQLSGANANSSQDTRALYVSNTHSGTSSTNYAAYFVANTGTTNRALYAEVTGGAAIEAQATSAAATAIISTATGSGGTAILATSNNSASSIAISGNSTNGIPGQFTKSTSGTNDIQNVLRIQRSTTGTAATGLGGSIAFYNEVVSGANSQSAAIASTWTDLTASTEDGNLEFFVTLNGTSTKQMTLHSNGDLELHTVGGGIILASPDGTRYKATMNNGGTWNIAAA